jgi:hypothetical protein
MSDIQTKTTNLSRHCLSNASYRNLNMMISERDMRHHFSSALHWRSDLVSSEQGSSYFTR